MNQEQFKALLQRDKLFLKEVFKSESSSKTKRLINFASDAELVTLIKYIHFVSNGAIKIKKENFETLQKKHLSLIKKHFEKKSAVQTLIQNPRKFKLSIFSKLIPVLSDLLTPLFKE